MQTYLVQLRGEDEDDGDDRLALAGRHYFLSSVPSSTFFFLLSFCFGSLRSVSSARLLPARSCSLFFFVFVCSEGEGGGATGDEVGAPALAGQCPSLFLPLQSSLSRLPWFVFFRLPPLFSSSCSVCSSRPPPVLLSLFLWPSLASIKPENGLSSRVRASRSSGTNASVSLRRNRCRKFALLCLVRFPVLFLFSSPFFFFFFLPRKLSNKI